MLAGVLTGPGERDRVVRILRAAAPGLRAQGIGHLSLFGSIARGEGGPGSDVDLLVEMDAASGLGLFDRIELEERLAARIGRPVHLAEASRMRTWLRAWIEPERIEI
jgi:predicted nucleotidyltransferase